MGNIICPDMDVAVLASVARDVCPFPNYYPSPHFVNMPSVNSSLHLKNHYTAVQSSLTPKQLEDFTQGLRTTFGMEGKVTLGGAGVVALSLAVLFDTLARQVRGEYVSESEPIPGLFIKNPRGYYPPQVYTASKYLRLVPHIANSPTSMKEETERYHKQFMIDEQSLNKMEENITILIMEDITSVNLHLSRTFSAILRIHNLRIDNSLADIFGVSDGIKDNVIFNFNCDPEAAHKDILNVVQKSDNHTQDIFKRYLDSEEPETWMQHIAKLDMHNVLLHFTPCTLGDLGPMVAQREDFDLKANALGKWAE